MMAQPTQSKRESAPLVLIVDDFDDSRAMYAEFLNYSGYRVEQAGNGLEAVELTQRLLPDAVVMDLSLPIVDGWEASRRLKADERTKRIPIIALTGHSVAGHAAGGKVGGCDALLVKPCLPEELVAKLEELLRSF
jgi:two-component system cell cycle response regulator DivK